MVWPDIASRKDRQAAVKGQYAIEAGDGPVRHDRALPGGTACLVPGKEMRLPTSGFARTVVVPVPKPPASPSSF